MATYRDIASTETDPQAPLTSALMKALDDNPTAIAEGALNAPKVQGVALGGVFVAVRDVTGTGYGNYTGLARAKLVRIDLWIENMTTAQSFVVGFSTNNGSSYGSDQIVFSPTGSSVLLNHFVIVLDLETGAFNVLSGSEYVTTVSGTLTAPANVNAFRVRQSAGTTDVNSMVTILSGVT
jgi:hypothetical protein